MSLNTYMHPRNPYRVQPDFKELALKCPDFRQFVKQAISGKLSIDFKDQNAVACLTTCLLRENFKLTVDLPPGRLIPTLPLRLNYLLWIEDMIQLVPGEWREVVQGIDIGTGSSCIYPLLGARKFHWRFLATESDPENYEFARKQVSNNNLHDCITVIKVTEGELLRNVVGDGKFAFTMCNPPFYGQEKSKIRNNRASPPHDYGGEAMEIAVEGGEVEFVSRIIEESKSLRDQICIFSTMLGHKSSVKPVLRQIEAAGAYHHCKTEFCQGRTMRWGVAWTFQNVLLERCPVLKREKPKAPVSWIVPQNFFKDKTYNVKQVDKKVLEVLSSFKMLVEPVQSSKYHTSYTVTANENTWIHQRRRRREEQRLKKLQNEMANLMECTNKEGDSTAVKEQGHPNEVGAGQPNDHEINAMDDDLSNQSENLSQNADQSGSTVQAQKRHLDPDGVDEHDSKRRRSDDSFDYSDELESELSHIARFKLVIQKTGPSIGLSMTWIDGTGGFQSLNEILVFLKNQLATKK